MNLFWKPDFTLIFGENNERIILSHVWCVSEKNEIDFEKSSGKLPKSGTKRIVSRICCSLKEGSRWFENNITHNWVSLTDRSQLQGDKVPLLSRGTVLLYLPSG